MSALLLRRIMLAFLAWTPAPTLAQGGEGSAERRTGDQSSAGDRLLERSLDGTCLGAPRKITDADVERVVLVTRETTPPTPPTAAPAQWPVVGVLAGALSAVTRKPFSLNRTKSFTRSKDPLYLERVRDLVGLHLKSPESATVLRAGQKSGIQALDLTASLLLMRPGQVERRTVRCRRHGTTDLFVALEVATSRIIARCQRRHRSVELRRFLIPPMPQRRRPDVHLVLDNSGMHKTALIQRWLRQRPPCHVHFRPTGSSQLNLGERRFGFVTEKQLTRGVHRCTRELEEALPRHFQSARTHQ